MTHRAKTVFAALLGSAAFATSALALGPTGKYKDGTCHYHENGQRANMPCRHPDVTCDIKVLNGRCSIAGMAGPFTFQPDGEIALRDDLAPAQDDTSDTDMPAPDMAQGPYKGKVVAEKEAAGDMARGDGVDIRVNKETAAENINDTDTQEKIGDRDPANVLTAEVPHQ